MRFFVMALAVIAQYSGSTGNGTAFAPSQAMAQLQLTQSCGEHGLLSKARLAGAF